MATGCEFSSCIDKDEFILSCDLSDLLISQPANVFSLKNERPLLGPPSNTFKRLLLNSNATIIGNKQCFFASYCMIRSEEDEISALESLAKQLTKESEFVARYSESPGTFTILQASKALCMLISHLLLKIVGLCAATQTRNQAIAIRCMKILFKGLKVLLIEDVIPKETEGVPQLAHFCLRKILSTKLPVKGMKSLPSLMIPLVVRVSGCVSLLWNLTACTHQEECNELFVRTIVETCRANEAAATQAILPACLFGLSRTDRSNVAAPLSQVLSNVVETRADLLIPLVADLIQLLHMRSAHVRRNALAWLSAVLDLNSVAPSLHHQIQDGILSRFHDRDANVRASAVKCFFDVDDNLSQWSRVIEASLLFDQSLKVRMTALKALKLACAVTSPNDLHGIVTRLVDVVSIPANSPFSHPTVISSVYTMLGTLLRRLEMTQALSVLRDVFFRSLNDLENGKLYKQVVVAGHGLDVIQNFWCTCFERMENDAMGTRRVRYLFSTLHDHDRTLLSSMLTTVFKSPQLGFKTPGYLLVLHAVLSDIPPDEFSANQFKQVFSQAFQESPSSVTKLLVQCVTAVEMCISEIELEDGILVRVFMDCPDDVVKNVFQTSSTPLQTTLAYCNMVLHGDHSKLSVLKMLVFAIFEAWKYVEARTVPGSGSDNMGCNQGATEEEPVGDYMMEHFQDREVRSDLCCFFDKWVTVDFAAMWNIFWSWIKNWETNRENAIEAIKLVSQCLTVSPTLSKMLMDMVVPALPHFDAADETLLHCYSIVAVGDSIWSHPQLHEDQVHILIAHLKDGHETIRWLSFITLKRLISSRRIKHEQILCYFGPLLFDPCSHIEEGVDAFLTVELDNSSSRMSFLMQLATKQILTERHTVQQLLDKFCPQSEPSLESINRFQDLLDGRLLSESLLKGRIRLDVERHLSKAPRALKGKAQEALERVRRLRKRKRKDSTKTDQQYEEEWHMIFRDVKASCEVHSISIQLPELRSVPN